MNNFSIKDSLNAIDSKVENNYTCFCIEVVNQCWIALWPIGCRPTSIIQLVHFLNRQYGIHFFEINEKHGRNFSQTLIIRSLHKSIQMKILMVCLGNICRSPLAEGIMKTKILEEGLDWEVDSAGTSHWHVNEPPDHRSVAVARRHGIDIRAQRGRQLVAADFDRFDLIYAMDSSNYNDIKRLAKDAADEEKLEMIMNVVSPGRNQSVPDPYYGNDGFQGVFDMLDKACDQVLEKYHKKV